MKEYQIKVSAYAKGVCTLDRAVLSSSGENRFKASYELGKRLKSMYKEMEHYVIHFDKTEVCEHPNPYKAYGGKMYCDRCKKFITSEQVDC